MRRISLLLVFAALVAGCSTAPQQEDAPDAVLPFHAVTDADLGFQCGSCHYGVGPVWQTLWHNATDADGALVWDLEVRAKYPTAALHAVQLTTTPVEPVAEDVERAHDGAPWRHEFQVPDGSTGLLVRFYARDGAAPNADSPVPRYDYPTALTLVDPDGAERVVDGPEGDLKFVVLADPAPGAWAAVATIDAGGAALPPVGVLRVSTWNATGSVLVDGVTEGDRFRFPDAGGRPPSLFGRLWPYHDHAPYEDADWDEHDLEPVDFTLTTLPGPAPRHAWTPEHIDPFWGGAGEVVLQQDRVVPWITTYEEQEGNRDDPRFYGSNPAYYVPADPIPPGTATLRVQITWTPPTDEPDLMVRVGPRGDARYHDMDAVSRASGAATFELPVRSTWWDAAFVDGEPTLLPGSLDVAPYFVERVGETVTRAMELRVHAVAVRG